MARLMPHSVLFGARFTSDSFWANVQANAKVPISLNELRDNPGAKKKKKRVGRGPGSKRGRTSTRGNKGAYARNTVARGFEGGQTPVWKLVRKFGFTNARQARRYSIVNLDKIQLWIDTGRLDPTRPITIAELIGSGCAGKMRRAQIGVKVLGHGSKQFKTKVHLEVTQASQDAIDAIKAAGGEIKLVHFTPVGMRALLHPDKVYQQSYRSPPPFWLNRRLRHPLQQPDQHPDWIAAHKNKREDV